MNQYVLLLAESVDYVVECINFRDTVMQKVTFSGLARQVLLCHWFCLPFFIKHEDLD